MTSHKSRFNRLARRDSQILEVGALCITTRHYEAMGYGVSVEKKKNGAFRVNTNARGRPWNFSHFRVTRGNEAFEIYANLAVQGAYGIDGAQYVTDVAVVKPDVVPRKKPQAAWRGTKNSDVLTFLEAKAIVIYPMLVAQFIGIVHEIKPAFLGARRPRGFLKSGHFDPTLVSLGYVHGISAGIVDAFRERNYHIGVVGHFDAAIRRVAAGDFTSPLL
jgi:hypothetical protein